MLAQSPAKINIGLHVVGKRPDGYHNLETIFYPIPLYDTLEINPLDSADEPFRFRTSGIPIPGCADDNLVLSVYKQMKSEFRLPALHISLFKRIPTGAGLGGGSSDAASMMMMLNNMFHLGLTDQEMEKRIAVFGADCPFFIRRSPVYATGIGTTFQPVGLDLTGLNLVLVKPDIHVSTANAYAFVKAHPADIDLRDAVQRPVFQWKSNVKNDFEASVFPQFPGISRIKSTLYDLGATYVSMSGSGSAVFALMTEIIPDLPKMFADCFTFQIQL